MTHDLTGKTIAFLATDGFEQSELTQPWKEIKEAGATVELVSIESGHIYGTKGSDKGDSFKVDKVVSEVSASDYNGLVLPGGVKNPDTLRMNEDAITFIRAFFKQHKPVAAICHGPVLLIEAGVVENRTLTSYPSIKTDIKNAGGNWVDEECVCDEALITSRSPEDLDAFCAKAIEEFAEGKHEDQVADAA